MIIDTRNYIVSPYSICFFLAFVFEFIFILYKFHKADVPLKIAIYSYLLNISLILYGGYFFTVLTKLIQQEKLTNIGFSSLGGVLGMLLGIFIFSKIYKKNKDIIYKTYILSLGLLYGISKLGCFLVGCCRGIEYDGLFKIKYITDSFTTNWIFPVQLCESIVFLITFIVFNKFVKKDYFISKTIIFYSLLKFCLDYLRYYENRSLFTINQIVCIILILITIFRYLLKRKTINLSKS